MNKDVIRLKPEDIPQKWFNAIPILPESLPDPKDPDDDKGSRIEIANKIRLKILCEQDRSPDQWVDIPKEVLKQYIAVGRPTDLVRAKRLEEYLETPARIYIKREDQLVTFSFKLNTALAQAYYANKDGAKGLVSETGAGQWGCAISYACNMFQLNCVIFFVKISLEQKFARATYMRMLGTQIFPSPSPKTKAGREILAKTPDNPGSLGTSIGEAVSFTLENSDYKYVSGSNLPHVLLHQTIIGLETKKQLELVGEEPDELIACVGGGSNLGGFMLPFVSDKLRRGEALRFLGAESEAAPRLTKGEYRYDHLDPVGITPLVLSYTLGMDYQPPPIHVGGLRQHSGSPVVGVLRHSGLLDAQAYSQEEALEAGKLFVQCESYLPAVETCHAIKATIDSALEAKKNNEKKTIVMCFSGNGFGDLRGYKEVLSL